MRVLDVIVFAAFATALIALPFVFYNWLRYLTKRGVSFPTLRNRAPIPIRSVLFFLIPLVIALGAAETSKEIGHDEVLRKLKSLKDDCRVSINRDAVQNSREVLSVLRTLDGLPAHHSNPTKRIDIEISDHAPRLVLSLARDSGDPSEYWVFWPKYRITANNEIGRIKTPLFDAY
jgi:hypothetical protein